MPEFEGLAGEPLEVPTIDADALMRLVAPVVIDLRSPSEFAADHIPGATNAPLFDDVQRALVGTIYRQVSPSAAFEEGRAIVRARIRTLVGEIAERAQWTPNPDDFEARVVSMTSAGYDRMSADLMRSRTLPAPADPIVLHCWRGGLRSRSVLALVRAIGLERATLLAGGYKGYRAHVSRVLAHATFPRIVVMRGLTGVGKTLVLREIERLRPGATLDLEALAGHRSSLLGMVGLAPCTQKTFESRISSRIAQGFGPVLIVEGESRKVGDAIVPPALWHAMTNARGIVLETSVERRVQVLCDDYLATDASRAQLRERLPHLEERLTRAADAESFVSILDAGRTDELVRLLLERHYDPSYRHSEKGKDIGARIDATDPLRAAREVLAWVDGPGRA